MSSIRLLGVSLIALTIACGGSATSPSGSSNGGSGSAEALVTVYWTGAFSTPSGGLMGSIQATSSIPATWRAGAMA